jgi:adenosylcobinamide kinase / adenosylcobinamide-phosphate guanylyltransferase
MVLILGSARSGKSRFAAQLAKRQCRRVAYIATAPVCDKEMERRISLHRKSRPKNWVTIEASQDLIPHLKKIPKTFDGIIIECVGTYISNLLIQGLGDPKILKDIKGVVKHLSGLKNEVFIVSNEVGAGIVPGSPIGRRFRDLVGSANQILAKHSDEVFSIIAGLPLKLK